MRRALPILLLVLAVPGMVRADAIVRTFAMKASTIAEYYVEEDGARVV